MEFEDTESEKYHTYKKESPKSETCNKRVVTPSINHGNVVQKGATKPLDRIQCDVCDCVYMRANGSVHRQSKRHKLYLEVQKKNWKIFKSTLS